MTSHTLHALHQRAAGAFFAVVMTTALLALIHAHATAGTHEPALLLAMQQPTLGHLA